MDCIHWCSFKIITPQKGVRFTKHNRVLEAAIKLVISGTNTLNMDAPTHATKTPMPHELLTANGEMGQLILSKDWSQTSLGPADLWPQSLRTTVSTCLNSRFPILIWWGPELVMLYNDAYRPILGEKHPASLGEKGKEVWPEVWDIIGPMLEGVYKQGISTWSENQLLLLDRYGFIEECYFTFSYSPIYDETGGIGGVYCAVTETTKTVLNERQLQTLKDLSNLQVVNKLVDDVYASATNALIKNNKDFPFAVIYKIDAEKGSAQPIEFAGIEKDQVVFPNYIDLNNPKEGTLNFTKAFTTKKILVSENNGRRRGLPTGAWQKEATHFIHIPINIPGSVHPHAIISAALNPYRKFNESYQQFASLIGDQVILQINTILAYEEERKRAEALAEIDKAKTVFFSNISHEFRTPLTLILGSLEELLKEDAAPAIENRKTLKLTHRNAMRLLRLVNNLLDFSRIEAGKANALFQPTDISAYTFDLCSTFRSIIESAGLTFQVHCDVIEQPLYVDREMWEKIVLNLLSNAYKYTLKGSISVSLLNEENNVVLKVKDTGIGIPKSELPKIFERFHKVENVTGRTQEGSGIGLSLIEELVKMHYGTIEVKSNVGEGSEFIISLPKGKQQLAEKQIGNKQIGVDSKLTETFIEEAASLTGATEKDALSADTQKEILLVVDDNADMRNYLQAILSNYYQVVTAQNGIDALDCLQNLEPVLIISDIMMPQMDGIELLKQVKSNANWQQIPVILLSARAGEEEKIEGYEIGADDYLVKPFSAKELLARVRAHIRLSRSRNTAEKNLINLFKQAPALIHILHGPDHVFDFFHPLGKLLIGRDLTGLKIRDALPEPENYGFVQLLDEVYNSGKTISQKETFSSWLDENGIQREGYFDFVYQPYYDDEGKIKGILIFAIDVSEKVKTRRKVEEREKELTALADAMPQLVWVANSQGDVLYYNNRVSEFAGASQQADGTWSWEGLCHPDDVRQTSEAWFGAVATGSVYETEHRIQMKNGSYRWYLSRAFPQKDEQGTILKWYGTATDIHAQKLTEEKLRFTAVLTQSIPDAVIGTDYIDNEYHIVSWNKAAESTYGWTAQEVIGKPARLVIETTFLSSEDRAAWERDLNSTGFWKGEVIQKKKDGSSLYIFASIASVKDGNGNLVGAVTVNRDITSQKESELIIRQNEQRFRTLIEAFPHLAWMANADGKGIYFNKRWYEYTGLTEQETIDNNGKSVVHPDDWTKMEKAWKDNLLIGEPISLEMRYRHAATGKYNWFLVEVKPIKNEHERTIQWVGTGTNIQHLKDTSALLEQQVQDRTLELEGVNKKLEQHATELQKSNDDLQQFAHVASHDLKEPVRKIKTFSNRLLSELEPHLPQKAKLYTQKIEASAERLFNMIGGILQYSSIDLENSSPSLVDLNEVVRSIEQDLEVLIEEKSAKLTYSHLPTIKSSPVLLNQLFYNLINNSLKFSKPGVPPEITITAAQLSKEASKERNLEARVYDEIVVRDNGIGFNESQAEKIFKTFTRLNSKDEYEGTGLGLALCKKIVDRHNGFIYASGQENEGAQFTILLPALTNA